MRKFLFAVALALLTVFVSLPSARAVVSTQNYNAFYTGNSSQTTFSYPNYLFEQSDLVVFYTTLSGTTTFFTLNAHPGFSFAGAADIYGAYPTGGNVTFLDSSGNPTAPPTGAAITITRLTPPTQIVAFLDNSPLSATVLEHAYDKLTLMAQTSYANIATTFACLSGGCPTSPPLVNGSMRYCADCQQNNVCAGSGTGAMATRIAGIWNCAQGQPSGAFDGTSFNGSGPFSWAATSGTGLSNSSLNNSAVTNSTITDSCINSICPASAFTGSDCGAKINVADAALGSSCGEIWVNQACGTAWTTAVSISACHVLRCVQGGVYTTSGGVTLAGKSASMVAPIAGMLTGTATDGNCTLKAANSANLANLVTMSGKLYDSIRGFTLVGNKTNGGTSTGGQVLYINDSGRPTIDHVTVQNGNHHGVQVYSSGTVFGGGGKSCCGKILDLMSLDNAADGLLVTQTSDTFVAQSELEQNGGNGINLQDSPATRLVQIDSSNNTLDGLLDYGTVSFDAGNTQLQNSQLADNSKNDVELNGSSTGAGSTAVQGVIINGNIFGSGNGGARPNNTYDAILIQDAQATITGNTISNSAGHLYALAIQESAPSSLDLPSSIVGNTVQNAVGTESIGCLNVSTICGPNQTASADTVAFNAALYDLNHTGAVNKNFRCVDDAIVLSGGTGTQTLSLLAKFVTFANCLCSDTSAANACGIALSIGGTDTVTITGSGGDVVAYRCCGF